LNPKFVFEFSRSSFFKIFDILLSDTHTFCCR
jgi:hypothetical protein